MGLTGIPPNEAFVFTRKASKCQKRDMGNGKKFEIETFLASAMADVKMVKIAGMRDAKCQKHRKLGNSNES